jgi:CHAD domain-containing protein
MSEQTNTNQPNEEQKPLGVLFGVLAYNNEKEFEEYIDRLNNKSVHDVLITIHSALRYAQASGVFSVEESEAVSVTLRKMKEVIISESN